MPEIGILSTAKRIKPPSINARTQKLDALVVGGGKDTFDLGRKGFVKRTPLSTTTVSSLVNGSAFTNEVIMQSIYPGSTAIDITSGTEVDKSTARNLLAVIERTLYVGSVDAANVLSSGSSITESDWQIIYTGNSVQNNNDPDVLADTDRVLNNVYVRNISAGTVDVIIHVYVRYLLNTSTD